eukprot:2428685-Amphidinium_carterae.1
MHPGSVAAALQHWLLLVRQHSCLGLGPEVCRGLSSKHEHLWSSAGSHHRSGMGLSLAGLGKNWPHTHTHTHDADVDKRTVVKNRIEHIPVPFQGCASHGGAVRLRHI